MQNKNSKNRVRTIFTFVLKAMAILFILLLLVSAFEVNKVLHPPRQIAEGNTLRKYDIEYHDIDLITEDGIRLSAWYTPPRNGAVILLAHGYGEKRPEWVYEMLARTGYGVLAWDARAHGESDGEISTIGYLEVLDVKAALEYALSQPGVKHIGAWGGSMGASTLILAAAQFPQIEALFVDSPFSSLDDELNFLVPYPVINPLAKFLAEIETGININKVSPVDAIGRISPRPVFIVQGLADTVAPPDSGEKLFNAAHEPRFLWAAENVPHLQMYLDNPHRYQRRLVGFFDEWLLGN
jgi:fermentation-respiration switch protein FrsA (DUF1100 family)